MTFIIKNTQIYTLLAIILTIFCSSCSDDSKYIHTYSIPKENEISGINLPFKWKKPEHWVSSSPGAMKKAQFNLSFEGKSAEAFLVLMKGKMGSLESNINRWRGQIGLDAVKADDIQLSSLKTAIGTLKVYTCENKEKDQSSTIAFWEQGEDNWFFKISGHSKVVDHEREHFISMLKSMQRL